MIQLSNFPKNRKNSIRILFFGILFISCYLSVDPNNWLSAKRSNFSPKIETTHSLFRVTFGLKDKEQRAWNGSLKIIPNQKLQVEIDAFRVHDFRATGFGKKGIVFKDLGNPDFLNDYLPDNTSWVCSTREASMHGPTTEWHVNREIPKPIIQQPSILVHVLENRGNQPVWIKTKHGGFSFNPKNMVLFRPQFFLNKNIKVEMLPLTQYVAKERLGQQDFSALLTTRSGELWMSWQEYDGMSDQVLVRKKVNNQWSPVSRIEEKSDVFRTVLAEDSRGRVWVLWSMKKNGNWDLYGKSNQSGTWSSLERLTTHQSPDIYHQAAVDFEGRLWIVWQRTVNGLSQILAKYWNGKTWSKEQQLSEGLSAQGNNWWPVIATGPSGSLAVAWDGYASGNYDIYLRQLKKNIWAPVKPVVATGRFEAHPTVAIDSKQRVWLAWDESGPEWGKDTGFLVKRKGTQLHESRSINLICLDGDRVLTTRNPLQMVLYSDQFWELPHLQLDSQDRPWLFVRHLVMRQPDTPLEGPIDLALWEIQVTRYQGDKWTPLIVLPRSNGRNDMMPATAISKQGDLWATWSTDHRNTKSYLPHQLQVQLGRFESDEKLGNLDLVDYQMISESHHPIQPLEEEQVKKIRSYRIQLGQKQYSIYRGDLHRHTDVSLDGNNDGSLLDAYRYARDAAALDFVGVADHTDAIEEFYNWWHSHKVADLFQVSKAFVSFYGYERSVEFPNGHRNIFFIKRGNKITPISRGEARGVEGTERLFWHLNRTNGLSVPHTTGRTSGTDWRDNDPKVENLVELFQGMRDTYEYPGAPRPKQLWTQFFKPNQPVPRASSSEESPSFRELGFVWKALEKGYKLGFIASSDHISGHISYACLLAEELTPTSLLEAVRARRAYAATDNLILDIRAISSIGEHLIGEVFHSNSPIRIKANILGTGTIQQVDVIKNGQFLKTLRPNKRIVKFEFAESKISPGQSYYYVRVIQKNGEMAWASPFWVTY